MREYAINKGAGPTDGNTGLDLRRFVRRVRDGGQARVSNRMIRDLPQRIVRSLQQWRGRLDRLPGAAAGRRRLHIAKLQDFADEGGPDAALYLRLAKAHQGDLDRGSPKTAATKRDPDGDLDIELGKARRRLAAAGRV